MGCFAYLGESGILGAHEDPDRILLALRAHLPARSGCRGRSRRSSRRRSRSAPSRRVRCCLIKLSTGTTTCARSETRKKDIPVVTLDDVKSADGYFFGSPTRFGNMAAQMKQFFDTMGAWMEGAWKANQPVFFTSPYPRRPGNHAADDDGPAAASGSLIVGIPIPLRGLRTPKRAARHPMEPPPSPAGRGELQPAEQDLFFVSVQAKRIAESGAQASRLRLGNVSLRANLTCGPMAFRVDCL